MAKYIVNCLHLSGKGKNMFKSGDVVNDDNFYEGQAEEYLKSGHLKEKPVAEAKKEQPKAEENKEEAPAKEEAKEEEPEAKEKAPKGKHPKK